VVVDGPDGEVFESFDTGVGGKTAGRVVEEPGRRGMSNALR
jgi:hypothetical protein